MQETWIEIEGYPNYAISNSGQVLNLKTDKILRARSNGRGYLRVALSRDGETQDFYIHHLVAKAFLDMEFDGEQIIHFNGDKEDNAPENLRLKKRRRAVLLEHGPIKRREEEHPRQWGKRVMIVETGEIFRTVRDCARYIEGDYSSIYGCLRGERQTHRGYTFEYYDW